MVVRKDGQRERLMRNFGAIILSAGLSSRMGAFKPLLSLAGKSALQRAVELFADCGQTLVVTGHRGEEVAAEAGRLGACTVLNPEYEQGMFASVCAGVRALRTGLDGFFILPVDIPLIRPWVVRQLVQAFSGGKQVVFPTFKGERGHPPLISAELISAILAHDGQGGLRTVLEAPDVATLDVPTFDRNILLDMDTPEAFQAAKLRVEALGVPDKDEAKALQDIFCLSPMGVAHGNRVADVALALVQALNSHGAALDENLVYAAALVHDLAKGAPKHELEGGRVLASMGLPEMAEIVAAHRDVPPPSDGRLTEKAVVCLADKLVRGPMRLSVSQRFDEKLAQYADDAEACAAIQGRKNNALGLLAMVERTIGSDIETLLSAKGLGK